jgi:hypothetical protein
MYPLRLAAPADPEQAPPPPPLVPTTPHAPASLLCVVKTYLRKLTPDGRAALLDLVEQEEHVERLAKRAAELGVQ